MERTSLVILVLLVALAASNAAWVTLYSHSKYNTENLLEENQRLSRQLELLANKVKELDENNTRLLLQLRDISTRYQRLLGLLQQANSTIANAAVVARLIENLNTSLTTLYTYTNTHAYYTPRVRSLFTPGSVADLVMAITGHPVYTQGSALQDMEKLYDWVQENIQDAPDHNFVAVKDPEYVEIGGSKYIYSFQIDIVDNYIQSPSETLQRMAGDCEDQSILLASMYKIYLGDVGDAWVLCMFSDKYDHCVAIAWIGPEKTFILADPTLDYYGKAESLRSVLDDWLGYVGMSMEQVRRMVAFNNKEYIEDVPYNVIHTIEEKTLGQG
ncbi:hypothetical protein Pyrde_0782 [Pyrodictium delaneyi]|uniref:Transglutaminase-like domain-containing protein n=1 Tax=Pyrodictium delaneyi TaxID=1273541 RepID=A0A0P0N3Q8_9CREN|nr:hypothetical protein [Pyrodictium delaneyi]ALL00832.1 hypothetical protein Pyrde_0782 [Pyrodictium delaneyi]OWJ55537.1 hypothetical protein Pdsh_01740 [Pyrodictium delaneyi]